MLTSRTYILARDWRRLEALLLREPAFYPLGGRAGGPDAAEAICRLGPDFLVLDGVLPGLDALALLDTLARLAAPPRVLYLNALGDDASAHVALARGVDAVLNWPAGDDDFLCAARNALHPLPGLAAASAEKRLVAAQTLLDDLGMSPRLRGRRYAAQAVAMVACAPWLLSQMQDGLYPLLAEQFATTPAAVERALRTAVESAWLGGNLSAIQRLFGLSVDADRGKPTNAEFLAMLAQHVRESL